MQSSEDANQEMLLLVHVNEIIHVDEEGLTGWLALYKKIDYLVLLVFLLLSNQFRHTFESLK